LADGSEFLLVAIDEFDNEIARTRGSPSLMALLEARARQSSTVPLDEVKTIDHKDPVTLGGRNVDDNLVTTSMARNNAKMNYSLQEPGWTPHEPGSFEEWDGLLHWFLRYPARETGLLTDERVDRWYRMWQRAAKKFAVASD
jgi:hypothetical protein